MWIYFTAHLPRITMRSVIMLYSEQWGMCSLLLRPSHWHTVLANTPDFLRGHQVFIASFCSNNSPSFLPIFTHFPLLVITACSCHGAACIHCSVLFCSASLFSVSEWRTEKWRREINTHISSVLDTISISYRKTERKTGNEFWEAWWCCFWSQRLHWLQS